MTVPTTAPSLRTTLKTYVTSQRLFWREFSLNLRRSPQQRLDEMPVDKARDSLTGAPYILNQLSNLY